MLFIAFSHFAKSQNYRLIQDFDKIPMGTKQFEAEGMMKSFGEFNNITKDLVSNFYPSDYFWIRYETKNNQMAIMLCFYKSTLYIKTLAITYGVDQLAICKEELKNIQKHILSNNKIVNKGGGEITNAAYGGVIGYLNVYHLNNSLRKTKSITTSYAALLDFDSPTDSKKPKISGYAVEYSTTDLSKTDLDAIVGYTTFQIN